MTPSMALLLLAGLQTMPEENFEAAEIDGAGKLRQFVTITQPLLKQAMAAVSVVTVPLVVLVLIFQRRIVAGLTAGAIKG